MAGLVLLVLVLAAVVIGLRASERGRRAQHSVRLQIVCPRGAGPVLCELVRDVPGRSWVDVERCSAFVDPEDVFCPKSCMKLLNLRFGGEERPGE